VSKFDILKKEIIWGLLGDAQTNNYEISTLQGQLLHCMKSI